MNQKLLCLFVLALLLVDMVMPVGAVWVLPGSNRDLSDSIQNVSRMSDARDILRTLSMSDTPIKHHIISFAGSSSDDVPAVRSSPNAVISTQIKSVDPTSITARGSPITVNLTGWQEDERHTFSISYTDPVSDVNYTTSLSIVNVSIIEGTPRVKQYTLQLHPLVIGYKYDEHQIYADLKCSCSALGYTDKVIRKIVTLTIDDLLHPVKVDIVPDTDLVSFTCFGHLRNTGETKVFCAVTLSPRLPIWGYDRDGQPEQIEFIRSDFQEFRTINPYADVSFSFLVQLGKTQSEIMDLAHIILPLNVSIGGFSPETYYVDVYPNDDPDLLTLELDKFDVAVGEDISAYSELFTTYLHRYWDGQPIDIYLDDVVCASGRTGEDFVFSVDEPGTYSVRARTTSSDYLSIWSDALILDVFSSEPVPDRMTLDFDSTEVLLGDNITGVVRLYNGSQSLEGKSVYIQCSDSGVPIRNDILSGEPFVYEHFNLEGNFSFRAYYHVVKPYLASEWVRVNVTKPTPDNITLDMWPNPAEFASPVNAVVNLTNTTSGQRLDGIEVRLIAEPNVGSLPVNFKSGQVYTISDMNKMGDIEFIASLPDTQLNVSYFLHVNEPPLPPPIPDNISFKMVPDTIPFGGRVSGVVNLTNATSGNIMDLDVNLESNPPITGLQSIVKSGRTFNVSNVNIQGDVVFTVSVNSLDADYTIHVNAPPPSDIPIYDVPVNAPNRTNRTFTKLSWLNFTLPLNESWDVVKEVHNWTWNLSIPTPYDLYVWMRGSAGEVNLSVSNKTREQLRLEAMNDTNPLLFITNISTQIVDIEDGYLGYVTSLVRNNPFSAMWSRVSYVLGTLVPGFIWNLLTVVVVVIAGMKIRELFK